MTTGTPQFQMLPIAHLQLSKTPAQVERRKRFDPAALAELAGSIRELGVQQPIIVRPVKVIRTPGLNGVTVAGKTYFSPDEAEKAARNKFEVVAGERRVLASKQAELTTIPAMVREYTDQQVLEVQLIENLQREGLHELDEAEGYDALVKQHGFTVDDLVAKVGKSKGYVYGRLKLMDLCTEVRKALSAGKLVASVALEIARIPVHDLQRKVFEEAERMGMNVLETRDHIRRNYHLRLDQAPFDTADAGLVAKAGPCGSCPKRTGNQRELFGDVKSADICTDPPCFAAKKKAFLGRVVDDAKAKGKEVIGGAEAKKIAPYGPNNWQLNGYYRLSEKCYEDKKHRTYGQILGKHAEVKHLVDADTGKLVPVIAKSTAVATLKAKGIKTRGEETEEQRARERRADAKQAFEKKVRVAVLKALYAKPPKKLERADIELIVQDRIDSVAGFNDGLDDALGFRATHGGFQKQLKKLSDAQVNALALLVCLADDYMYEDLKQLTPIAKRHGIDVAKITSDIKISEAAAAIHGCQKDGAADGESGKKPAANKAKKK